MCKIKRIFGVCAVAVLSVILIGCGKSNPPTEVCVTVSVNNVSMKYMGAQEEILKEVGGLVVALYDALDSEQLYEVVRAVCNKYSIKDELSVLIQDHEILIVVGEPLPTAQSKTIDLIIG